VPRDGIGRAYTAWVNIAAGWEGFEHAKWMRRWQNRDYQESLVTPFTPKPPPTVIDTAASGVAQLARRNERSPESVERVAKLAGAGPTSAPFRERGVADGRPVTEVALPDPSPEEARALVARAGGITEIDETDPAHPYSVIYRALDAADDLTALKAVWAEHGKAGHWTERHTVHYKRRRDKITGEPEGKPA
jgi:hypothetical protein